MWRFKRIKQWEKEMVKLYNLMKNGFLAFTYTEYMDLPSKDSDALTYIASVYNEITSQKLQQES